MSIKDKLISNTTYLSLGWFSSTLFFMLFWILLGKTLLPESYGIVATASQTATLLSTLSLVGLGTTVNKLIPELIERKQKNKTYGLILFSLKVTLISSSVISIGLIVFSTQISSILKLVPDVILLVAASTILMAFAGLIGYVYYGFQNMKKFFLTNLCGELSMIFFALLFIQLGLDYLGAMIALTLSYLIIFLARIEKGLFKVSTKEAIDKKLIFKYSIPAFVVDFFSVIFSKSQFIILASMQGTEVTGLFAVAMKIASVILIMPIIFSTALFPITSGLSIDKNSKSKQSYLVSLAFRYSVFIVLPLALFIMLFPKYLILLFSTEAYSAAISFLPSLVLGTVFLGLATPLLSSLYAIGNPKKYRDIHVISTLVYLFSAVILTYYFSAEGLAVSYFLSSALLFTITALFIKKYLTIKLPIKCIGKMLIGIVVSFLFLFFTNSFISNLWIAMPFIVAAGFIYFVTLLKLNFYVEEDLKILDFASEKTPIFKTKIVWFRQYLSKFVKKSYMDA